MYIIGAVEILMVYIVGPQMSLFGPDISIDSVKFNNFRVYGTFFVMGMYIINLYWKKNINKIHGYLTIPFDDMRLQICFEI